MQKTGKKPFKKIELTIYFLAVMAFSLLVYLFVNRNETSIVLKEDSSKIQDKALAYNSDTLPSINADTQDLSINESPMPDSSPIETLPSTNLADQDNKIMAQESTPAIKDTPKAPSVKKPAVKAKVAKKVKKVASNKKYNKAKKSHKRKVAVNQKRTLIDPKTYNWTVLSRYKGKPNNTLYQVNTYKVKAGDSLWRVAKKFNVAAINLIAANPSLEDPDQLIVGNTLVIPHR